MFQTMIKNFYLLAQAILYKDGFYGKILKGSKIKYFKCMKLIIKKYII